MFEPVHGSAPDIAGRGRQPGRCGVVGGADARALGHEEAADDLLAAMESTLAKPETRTGDLGGSASTVEVTEALVAQMG